MMNYFYPPQGMHHNVSSRGQMKIVDRYDAMTDDLATTLFLGDLAVICDETKVYELFRRFGVVESVQLKKSDRDPQRAHLGFGFIKFATRESAERALQEMNGCFFLGRAMRVGWALDFGKKGSQSLMEQATDPKKNQTAQIHVMFVTRELHRRVSELDIGAVFSRYGNLLDIAIKKNCINQEYGVQSGYAFLHFALTPEGLRSAITAVEEGNLLVVDNITYRCKVTHSLQAQLMSTQQKDEQKPVKRNLPPSLTHAFPSPFDDSTLETYNSPARVPLTHSIPSSVSEYHDKDFPSYNMSPTKTMNRTEQYYEVLPPPPLLLPAFHDLHSVQTNEPTYTISNDRITMNEQTANLIYPSFTVNTSTTSTTTTFTDTTIPQEYFDDNYHLPVGPLSSSSLSSSSFIHSTYEDLSMMRSK